MATALKDKLVTLEDLLAFYNEMKGKVEMWEDVTSELGAWGTNVAIGTTTFSVTEENGSTRTKNNKIILRNWNSSKSSWEGIGTAATSNEGADTKHAYMNVSEHQMYRLTAFKPHYGYQVCFFRSDGSPLLALTCKDYSSDFVWNNTTMTAQYNAYEVGLTIGTFMVPKNATRMMVINGAPLYNQPINDFILERLIR